MSTEPGQDHVAVSVGSILQPSIRRWLPDRPCQVRKAHLGVSNLAPVAFGWGIELGLGICTFAVTPGLFALLALALGQDQPVEAGVIFVAYGIVRGGTIAIIATINSRSREGGRDVGAGLEPALRLPLVVAIFSATIGALL